MYIVWDLLIKTGINVHMNRHCGVNIMIKVIIPLNSI